MVVEEGQKAKEVEKLKKFVVLFAISFFLIASVKVSYVPAYQTDENAITIESLDSNIDIGQFFSINGFETCDDENMFLIPELPLQQVIEIRKIPEMNEKPGPKTPEQLYFPIIEKISSKYEVDPLLVKAVIVAESGFRVNAVSSVGAQGLMQLMPRTAKAMGVEDSFNPEHNIAGGVKYLKKLLDKYNGNIEIALAAYNAGSRNVRKYKGVPPYRETKKYIKKVSALHEKYKKTLSDSASEICVSQI